MSIDENIDYPNYSLTNKKFDAVKSMRDIREKLSEKYWKHPEILKQEMDVIRKKYNIKAPSPKMD